MRRGFLGLHVLQQLDHIENNDERHRHIWRQTHKLETSGLCQISLHDGGEKIRIGETKMTNSTQNTAIAIRTQNCKNRFDSFLVIIQLPIFVQIVKGARLTRISVRSSEINCHGDVKLTAT